MSGLLRAVHGLCATICCLANDTSFAFHLSQMRGLSVGLAAGELWLQLWFIIRDML